MSESDLGLEIWVTTSYGFPFKRQDRPFCTKERALSNLREEVNLAVSRGWVITTNSEDMVKFDKDGHNAGIYAQRKTLR